MSIVNKFLKPVTQTEIDAFPVHTEASLALAPILTYRDDAATAIKKTDVNTYFVTKGFDIRFNVQSSCIDPVEDLALLIAVNYRACKAFLKYIRENMVHKCFHINYCVAQLPENDRDTVVSLAERFGEYGIISNVFYNRNTGFINGIVSSAPRIINFINGDYLEFYGRAVSERVVKEVAIKHNVDYEVYSNVVITKAAEKHELDIVFRVGEYVFWSEIKSGKFSDFDNYRKLGVLMGVNPDRHILLVAEKDNETAEAISWFYQFYVSNIDNFRDKLIEMIDKAFEGGNNND